MYGLQYLWLSWALGHRLSSVAHGLSRPTHCMYNLPGPGIGPTSPALQMDSLPVSHQGSPIVDFFFLH